MKARAALRCLRGVALALLCAPAALRAEEAEPKPPADQGKISLQAVLAANEPVSGGGERVAELFWAAVSGEWKRQSFGARVEVRGREGRFRSFYPGSLWLEEGYAFVATPAGELRVGKVVRRFGLPDETLGGNLFSENGVTRNPDWGAALAGSTRLGWDSLEWQAAALLRNDRVSWEEPGQGIESDPYATLREGLEARVSYLGYVWNGLGTLRPGISGGTSRIRRDPATDPALASARAQELRRNEANLELTATVGPIAIMGQHLWRSVSGTGEAPGSLALAYEGSRGWLAGIRAEFPTVTYRYEVSGWSFGSSGDVILHRPSVVWTPVRGLAATVEYSSRLSHLGGSHQTLNSLRLGLALTY